MRYKKSPAEVGDKMRVEILPKTKKKAKMLQNRELKPNDVGTAGVSKRKLK